MDFRSQVKFEAFESEWKRKREARLQEEFEAFEFLWKQIRFGPLSWREDAEVQLDDWTIEITSEHDATVSTYLVHKVVLGVGERRSRYFEREFESKLSLKESHDSTSRISFRGSVAQAFPEVLDYIYTGQCNFSSENTVALRFLARYFDIPTLLDAVEEFTKSDVTPASVHIYHQDSMIYHDDYMLEKQGLCMPEIYISYSTGKSVH